MHIFTSIVGKCECKSQSNDHCVTDKPVTMVTACIITQANLKYVES